MFEIFKFNGKWRIKIVDETFEFDYIKELKENLKKLLDQKEKNEPHTSIGKEEYEKTELRENKGQE